ncbi:tRNA dihydrouridine synthase [Mycoemilia scoparia]|uniref:tRNA-dihydrouridine(16/17) synthase [NAD(P)(+)] n=1 Tax=Mycoemilia scoparia TaxID=417184 RepID=A0A9W8DPI3_9FUNG|nr:tRNA dihydrouridine synthase [Mycoemilia scoparia]
MTTTIATTTAESVAESKPTQEPQTQAEDTETKLNNKPEGYDFFRNVLKSPKYVVAPMVDQSELAWRVLSRKYGADLCYTPMFHARMFGDQSNSGYYRDMWEDEVETGQDRPLIVQFCANDPDNLLRAARLVEDKADAVDLNLGCPQHIAKRGHYGSFLMEDWDLVYKMINNLHRNLKIPVTAKIRVYPDVEKSVEYAKMVESAGAQMITVHGRLREQKGHKTGLCDWNKIKAVKEAVKVPVIANGNILYFEDIQRCIDATGVDGVMSAETNLYNPALFSGLNPPVWQMADEYLDICRKIPTKPVYIRGHLFKLFRQALPNHIDIRQRLAEAKSLEDMSELSGILKERLQKQQAEDKEYDPSKIYIDEFGYRIYPSYLCQPAIRREFDKYNSQGEKPLGREVYEENIVRVDYSKFSKSKENNGDSVTDKSQNPDEPKGEKRASSPSIKQNDGKPKKNKVKESKQERIKKISSCLLCSNVLSPKCTRHLCKNCCRGLTKSLESETPSIPELPENALKQRLEFEWTAATMPFCETHAPKVFKKSNKTTEIDDKARQETIKQES